MKQFILTISLLVYLFVGGHASAQNVSLNENENYRIEKVYPNPVTDQLTLEIDVADYSHVQFELIDILGNQIKRWQKMKLVPGQQKVKLDLQQFNPGFYLIKANFGDHVIVKRVRKL